MRLAVGIAVALSVAAVGLSVWALTRSGSSSGSAGTCGYNAEGKLVACSGTGAPPSSTYGACTPLTRSNGVFYWKCERH